MARVKLELRQIRKKRIRKKVWGTKDKPRLSVFRSLRYVYAQLIDDLEGKTLVYVDSKKTANPRGNQNAAKEVGVMIAERAKSLGIKKVAFDRNGYRYHGVIKSLADGARSGGLEF